MSEKENKMVRFPRPTFAIIENNVYFCTEIFLKYKQI